MKCRAKSKNNKPVKKIIYEDTSSEESEDEEASIVNYAKIIKKTARERLKDELNQHQMNQAMSSLGYILKSFLFINTKTDIVESDVIETHIR